MDIENEEPGQLAGFQSYVQRLQKSIEMMQQSLQKAVQEPKVVYNLSGATIQGSVIGGSITKNGAEYYSGTHAQKAPPHYTDEQIAHALANIVGKNKAIDSKQKWAGAMWLLRWECNYPSRTMDFCEKIATLPLPEDLEYKCDYNNIRAIGTLSFMDEDARHLDTVRYSKNDELIFQQMKGVVIALREELRKTAGMKDRLLAV